jgi:hypothetical protein
VAASSIWVPAAAGFVADLGRNGAFVNDSVLHFVCLF